MESTETEDIQLASHPFRGVLVTICVIVAAMVVMAVLWFVWAQLARRRLQSRIDAIAANHQPFQSLDFDARNVPDHENAAVLWKTAFAALPTGSDCPSNSNMTYSQYPPFPAEWHRLEDTSLPLCAKAIQLAHIAAAEHSIDWGPESRWPFTMMPLFSKGRELANVLGDAIIQAHLAGADNLAIERATDLISMSRAQGNAISAITGLVSFRICSLCTERLLLIAPDLRVANGQGDRGGADRKQIELMIRLLLDEQYQVHQRVAIVDFERFSYHQILNDEKKSNRILEPMIDLSDVRNLDQRSVDRWAASTSSQMNASRIYESAPASFQMNRKGDLSAQWGHVFGDGLTPMEKVLDTQWKCIANQRCAAIALAICLFRVDHSRLPESLTDLLPTYLATIPEDPFLPNHTTIGYIIRKNALPGMKDRPMLYFHLTGDPQTAALPAEPAFGWNQKGGQWCDLLRWYPANAAPSSQQAVSH